MTNSNSNANAKLIDKAIKKVQLHVNMKAKFIALLYLAFSFIIIASNVYYDNLNFETILIVAIWGFIIRNLLLYAMKLKNKYIAPILFDDNISGDCFDLLNILKRSRNKLENNEQTDADAVFLANFIFNKADTLKENKNNDTVINIIVNSDSIEVKHLKLITGLYKL